MVGRISADRPVVCEFSNDHERGVSELSVVTSDAPGLFARIAGILTLSGINIVDAELYTRNDGIAVDLIRVTDLEHRPIEDPARWQRIVQGLSAVAGGAELDSKLAGQLERRLVKRVRRGGPQVEVDNDVSAAETVLEVHADDRPGLLYRIARAVAANGCTIHRARITTHVDRVVDVFYIHDSDGNKITGRERLDTLRNALLDELGI
jgi:[protein-PII] uridylyltransferase